MVVISEDDVNKKRSKLRNLQLDISDIEELDSKDHENMMFAQQQALCHKINQFDAIQEENEEDLQN